MIASVASNVAIRFFEARTFLELEKKVNKHLSNTQIAVYDIRYSHQMIPEPKDVPALYVSAMIIYVHTPS
ncbi:DUF2536 family protein [Chloroflexota bacterium]